MGHDVTATSEVRWVRTKQYCRCTQCGDMVDIVWLCYTTTTTWVLALCEPCVAEEVGA